MYDLERVEMKKIISISAIIIAGLSITNIVNAGCSGAGCTMQPSLQWQQQQAESQQRANTHYYQTAPSRPSPSQTTWIQSPTGIPGYAPIPVPSPTAPAAQSARQIGAGLIESNPKLGPYVAGAAITGFVAQGIGNSVIAGGSVASAIAQPTTATAVLPGAVLRAGMAANNFRNACNAGAWLDYAARVQQQQACLPYPGMK
jgi:hypothetical protein